VSCRVHPSREPGLLFGIQSTPEHSLHGCTTLVDIRNDAFLDSLPNGGNSYQHCWLEFLDVAEAVAAVCCGESSDGTVAHSSAPEQTRTLEHELENVRQRQVGEQ